MMTHSIKKMNDLYLERMELTNQFVKLHQQLQKELDLANLCISKAKTTHGISLFSVKSFDSHDLEPSIRIDVENGKDFSLIGEPEKEKEKEEKDDGEEELNADKKNSGESEDVEEEKKSPFAGQFRPFGVLESSAAKDARKIMRNSVQTLLSLASVRQSIAEKSRQLIES
uniref:Vacuolar ATPase assembly protein VMA22 n=1 Tax=Caenorhabditis japonica TaxID=281687 RepID=A0A8R1I242_CAEJA